LPLKLIELSRKNNIRYFINTDTILDKRVSHYSLSKKQFRDWLDAYSKNMVCVNMALEHFYGPYDDKTKFVSYAISQMLSGAERIDLTEGLQKRDFIYIDDVVEAFMAVIRNTASTPNGFYNFEIGSNHPTQIRELLGLIKKISANERTLLNFGALPYRENEIMESNVNTAAIRKLGWMPNVSLEDGLARTVELERKALAG
jgi:nucleoside-diphosphate-sugar epimerase